MRISDWSSDVCSSDLARQIVAAKQNVRLLECGEFPATRAAALDFKRVAGGLLVQDVDTRIVRNAELKLVSKRAPTETEIHDLVFAYKVAKFVKSNAIAYAQDRMTLGVGAGQTSRVYSAKIAGIKAGDEKLEVPGSVMASDAIFPFRDRKSVAWGKRGSVRVDFGGS